MARRIIVINEFAHALDSREGVKRIPAHALRAGDVLGTGDRVTQTARDSSSDRVVLTLRTNGYPRMVSWAREALVSVAVRDGVGTPEEVAYGEGWHSTENVNPYTSAAERASWERGRAAKKQKFKLNSNSRREGEMAAGMKRKVGFEPPKKRIADFKSEKGYVAKLIDVKTGGVLARSEPHISNGEGLKKWIMSEAQKLIARGKRVKAEVGVEFFDPNMMDAK